MSKEIYIGVDGIARKVKKAYIGVNGQARKVKKAYVGVGGVAKLINVGKGQLSFYGSSLNNNGSGFKVPSFFGDYPFIECATASNGNYALYAGGRRPSYNSYYWNDVYAYDKNLTVTSAARLKQSVTNNTGVSFGKYAVIAGGYDQDKTNEARYVQAVEAYDQSLTKISADDLSMGSNGLRGAATDQIFILGGGRGGTTWANAYDSSLTRIGNVRLAANRVDHYAVANKTHIMFVGGESYGTGSYSVEFIDNSLTVTYPSPDPSHYRKGVGAVSVDGNFIINGGGSSVSNPSNSSTFAYDKNLTYKIIDGTSVMHSFAYGSTGASTEYYGFFAGGYTRLQSDSTTRVVDVYDDSLTHSVAQSLAGSQKSPYVYATTVGDCVLVTNYSTISAYKVR